jgi:glycosyltransferase involved in cell wall biosynthesis
MPKIAIDVSPLSDGNQVRGVGYYTKNLVSALQTEIKCNPDYHNYQTKLITHNSQHQTGFNLIHYPYFDPFKLTLPVTPTPFIVTVHDLIPREYKKYFPVGFRGEIKWLIQKLRLKKAKYIIVPSLYVKNAVSKIINYPLEQIFVTPEAADPSFQPIFGPQRLKSIQKKYNLPDKFALYVGDLNWNKNLPSLVIACLNLNYPLVIVGSAAVSKVVDHPWNRDIIWLQTIALKHQSSKTLILTGFVPDTDLPFIFNLATVYCQPSFSEGFGLPLLQAMQSGTATLFADCSSLPEISLLSGLSFNPFLPEDLQNKLTHLWKNPSLRQKYIKKAIIRSQDFSWNNTALLTLNIYRQALDGKK